MAKKLSRKYRPAPIVEAFRNREGKVEVRPGLETFQLRMSEAEEKAIIAFRRWDDGSRVPYCRALYQAGLDALVCVVQALQTFHERTLCGADRH